jgi:hypothetical protein
VCMCVQPIRPWLNLVYLDMFSVVHLSGPVYRVCWLGLVCPSRLAGPGRAGHTRLAGPILSFVGSVSPPIHVQCFAAGLWRAYDASDASDDESWGDWTSAGCSKTEAESPWSRQSWAHWDSSDTWHDSSDWYAQREPSFMYVSGAPPWFTYLSSEVHHYSCCVVQSGYDTA